MKTTYIEILIYFSLSVITLLLSLMPIKGEYFLMSFFAITPLFLGAVLRYVLRDLRIRKMRLDSIFEKLIECHITIKIDIERINKVIREHKDIFDKEIKMLETNKDSMRFMEVFNKAGEFRYTSLYSQAYNGYLDKLETMYRCIRELKEFKATYMLNKGVSSLLEDYLEYLIRYFIILDYSSFHIEQGNVMVSYNISEFLIEFHQGGDSLNPYEGYVTSLITMGKLTEVLRLFVMENLDIYKYPSIKNLEDFMEIETLGMKINESKKTLRLLAFKNLRNILFKLELKELIDGYKIEEHSEKIEEHSEWVGKFKTLMS